MRHTALQTALRLPGFWYDPGKKFTSDNVETSAVAIVLPDPKNPNDLAGPKERLVSFFKTIGKHANVYEAVRGGDLFWDAVIMDWHAVSGASDLPAAHTKEVANVIAEARGRWAGEDVTTELTKLVDEYIDLVKAVNALPPAAQIVLPHHPTPVVAVPAGQTGPNGIIVPVFPAPRWPPAHTLREDIVFLANDLVKGAVYGRTYANPGLEIDPPTGRTAPLAARIYLAGLMLATTDPNSIKALFLAPVAFEDNAVRQTWWTGLARQSKQYETIDNFLSYATSAFARGKTTVSGLFTPFFIGSESAKTFATVETGSTQEERLLKMWASNGHAARLGLAVVLRSSGTDIQVVIFDPRIKYAECAAEAHIHGMGPFNFGAKLTAAIKAWADETGRTVLEVWSEGYIGRAENAEDSVMLASRFLRSFQGGHIPVDQAGQPMWAALRFTQTANW